MSVQVDWSSFPINALHNYRSAYQIQTPSAYTQPHADLLYRSCELALRAPSQVVARKKAYDLKQYRKQQAQQRRLQTNGVSKNKSARPKESRGNNTRKKDTAGEGDSTLQPPIDEPPSPNSNSHPSLQDTGSNPSDGASRQSPTASLEHEDSANVEDPNIVPLSLNQRNPEATTIGSVSPTSLATSIRKHFNAQQLNEAETIARFTYVARQQGSSVTSRTQALTQRIGTTPLPHTIAENIALTAELAKLDQISANNLATNALNGSGTTSVPAAVPKSSAHSAHSIATTRTLGGQHIEFEGNYGDGQGWIMGTTSCGRQVRVQDGGGVGAFRLRFRP